MKHYKSWFAVGILALFIGCASSDFESYRPSIVYEYVDNIAHVEQLLANSLKQYESHEILVVFDFNYTLMYPLEPCLHTNNIHLYKKLFKEMLKKLSHVEADKFLTGLMTTRNQALVNQNLPLFLKQHKDVNFLVCSSSLKNNIDAYLNLLATNGVSIKNHYGLPEFEFNEFKSYAVGRPIYKNGVILTNREEKGAVLNSFLNKLFKKPKLVIFVDNSPKKLDSIKELASTLPDTKFVIVEYSEYKTKNIPQVSAEAFRKYWEHQLQLFKQRER
ncbi:MAG: DUF2608 domain-containing protein [Alphaproteobacteria bacterium]|nr:DUF2608 domain-containing protein [Alphaproteobacteria bacterium]